MFHYFHVMDLSLQPIHGPRTSISVVKVVSNICIHFLQVRSREPCHTFRLILHQPPACSTCTSLENNIANKTSIHQHFTHIETIKANVIECLLNELGLPSHKRKRWSCEKRLGCLTRFVFDENIHGLINVHLEGFVLGVFGLVWGHTSIGLGDKRLCYVATTATVTITTGAIQTVLWWHYDNAISRWWSG